MAEKKRINWLLILQGWTMLWVVIGHSSLGDINNKEQWPNYVLILFKYAYSFHMPLFMLISGYLFYITRMRGGYNYCDMLLDKCRRLLIPYVSFTIIAFAMKALTPGEMSRMVDLSLGSFIHSLFFPLDSPMQEMWFIATLFWMFILMPIWKILIKNLTYVSVTTIILLLLYYYHPEIKFLCLNRFFGYLIWFWLGMNMSKWNIVERIFSCNVYFTIGIGVLVSFLAGRDWLDIPLLVTAGRIVFSFGLALLMDKVIPNLFCSFRDYTFQIFLIGIFVQTLVKIAYRHCQVPYLGAYVLCIILGLYIPVIITRLLKRFNSPLLYSVGLKPIS